MTAPMPLDGRKPMPLDQVPDEFVAMLSGGVLKDTDARLMLAYFLPHVRAWIAAELREEARQWIASVKLGHTLDARERRHAIAAGLTQAADRIARGGAP